MDELESRNSKLSLKEWIGGSNWGNLGERATWIPFGIMTDEKYERVFQRKSDKREVKFASAFSCPRLQINNSRS